MARVRSTVERAASLHRQAVANLDAAAAALDAFDPGSAPETFALRLRGLAATLSDITRRAAPGWLSEPLTEALADVPTGTFADPLVPVRIGTVRVRDDASFPVVAPILGAGHLAVTGGIDARSLGLARSVLLRLIAATTPGSLRIRAVDPSGNALEPFSALFDGLLMSPPVTDRAGLRAVLNEAEQWVRSAAPAGRHLMLVIAGLPSRADATDLDRLRALAERDPASRISIVVAGDVDLPNATQISFDGDEPRIGALDMPTELDPDPPAGLIGTVCERVAAQARAADALAVRDLLADEPWQSRSATELITTVGMAGLTPLSLRLNDQTPHWLIGGRAGSGKTAFLINVLYGLCMAYPPGDLNLYLLDFSAGPAFEAFTPTDREPTWIPHTRVVGAESDRSYGLSVLRVLDAEMARREEMFRAAGVERFADYRATSELPRIVCAIEEFPALIGGGDRLATEAAALLDGLARRGRGYGIHLVMSAREPTSVESLTGKPDSTLARFPVRIAMPGGSWVLHGHNESATALRLGTAVVNMAGGLGGPAGAWRAHERLVEFPDPSAESKTMSRARRKLWLARPAGSPAPHVFQGFAPARPPKRIPRSRRPSAYLGHGFDIAMSPVTFSFDPKPGRHLAVIGPSSAGAALLDAATRSVAAQHKPGTVHFVLAPLLRAYDEVGVTLAADLTEAGHEIEVVDMATLRGILSDRSTHDTYVVGFGLDGTGAAVRHLLRDGPALKAHLIGWWRGLRRFITDVGESGRDDVGGLVLLNVPAADVSRLLDDPDLDWQPRDNRALVHDRQAARTQVVVPYARRSPR